MKIKAVNDCVVVKVDKAPTHSGCIELPQTAIIQGGLATASVLDIGPGVDTQSGKKSDMSFLSVGDRVFIEGYKARGDGSHHTTDSEGNRLVIVRSYEILAKIEE